MKRVSTSVCALMSVPALCLTCAAQSSPWDGSWKIEPNTLKFVGSTFSVATDAEGYTITRGGQAQPKVVCDGKPHPSADGTATTCGKTVTGYEIEATRNGRPARKTTVSVSADGKTRTSKSEIFPSDDDPFTMTIVAVRVSGGPGAAGEWKEVKFTSSTDNGILTIAVKGESVDFKETDGRKPVTCKLDGTETKFGDGGSMSVMLADPHTLKVTYKDDKGTVRRENTFALSADEKSITETDVTPAPSPSTMSVVLRKM